MAFALSPFLTVVIAVAIAVGVALLGFLLPRFKSKSKPKPKSLDDEPQITENCVLVPMAEYQRLLRIKAAAEIYVRLRKEQEKALGTERRRMAEEEPQRFAELYRAVENQ